MRSSLALLLALALGLAPCPVAIAAEPDDAVVAAIGYQIVPRSLLVAYRAAFAAAQPPAVALQQLIDDRLLAIEARRYALAPQAGELNRMRNEHPLPAGFMRAEWDMILLDRVLARRFMEFRFGDFVPVDRDEVLALIKAEPRRFPGPPEAAEAAARKALLPIVRARREEAFRAELRERVHVRFVPDALPPE